MKTLKTLFFILAFIASNTLQAQVAVNTDGSSADGSAILDLKSSDKGLLTPRMTQSEIESISSPANGLLVFCTTDNTFYVYLSAENKWKELQYGSGEIIMPASFTIGTGGSCANTIVNESYVMGVALTGSNTVNIDATVTTPGTWSIATNTTNGYSFSGSGTFTSTGTVQVTLNGTGTPTTAQTDNFTATAYGSGGTCTFSVTVASSPCGVPLSYGGQNYNTVQIGTQCWMADNLNIGVMIDGSSNQTNNSTIEKYCYDNNSVNCITYGGLYQWEEMMQYSTDPGAKGICPGGWHLPTDAEWMTLEEEVESTTGIDWNSTGWRGTDAGGNLKETGTSHWQSPNTGATNSSGFEALSGGSRFPDETFNNLTSRANYWSSSENGSDAWGHNLGYENAQMHRNYYNKTYGFSVRCLRDN
jgi:uncharacterized protein (TIGR02145 family)